MSIIKRGTVDSAIIVTSSIYSCSNCGHTEMIKKASKRGKKCPKCHENMLMISSQSESIEEK